MVIDEKDTVTKLTENLECIYKWLSCSRLSLNIEKTVFLEFGNKKLKTSSICFDSHPTEIVDDLNYPGLRLDSQLNFKKTCRFGSEKIIEVAWFANSYQTVFEPRKPSVASTEKLYKTNYILCTYF